MVAIEAARGQSLRGLVGARGLVYGIDRFGASAPYTDLAEFFGFTPDRVCARVLEHLRAPGRGAESERLRTAPLGWVGFDRRQGRMSPQGVA